MNLHFQGSFIFNQPPGRFTATRITDELSAAQKKWELQGDGLLACITVANRDDGAVRDSLKLEGVQQMIHLPNNEQKDYGFIA